MRLRTRRLLGALAMLLVLSVLVEIPDVPAAHAALGGLTNFEIDGNQVVNGPTPPSGGAGIDWANAAQHLQGVAQPTDFCGNGIDPTTLTGKLDAFDPFAPNPVPGNVSGKNDLCQAFTAWEPVDVTSGGVTTVHYVMYGGWLRQAIPGDMSFFVPLIGGPTKSAVTIINFDYNPGGGPLGSTTVSLLGWNGISWVPKTGIPSSAFESATQPANPPTFGEFAIDLTAAGILPSSQTCETVVSDYVMTRPGNGNADLVDYVGLPPLQISNCSTVRITKVTDPSVPDTPTTFSYNLDRVDGGPVQDTTALVVPNSDANPSLSVIAGSLIVPTSPTDNFANIFTAPGYRLLEGVPPPAPWAHQSIVCNYFDPTVLDPVTLKATPATAVLTNPDGSWTGQTFTVAPTAMLPAGATVSVDCTISNQAPTLTLAKHVVNTVLNAPATPDMWTLSATPTAGTAVDFGPGTSNGVRRTVAPSTYTLAETPNTSPAPPAGYAASAWSCVDAANNPVTVTGGNQVTVAATANISCTITNTAQDLARLTLVKVVPPPGADPASAFTLTAQKSATNPGSISGSPITGVTTSPAVTDVHVLRGVFSLSETGPAGYLESWQCTDGTGAVVSTVNQVTVPANFTDPLQLDITCTATNTTTAIDVNITGAAVNPAGRSHTFTLTANRVDTGAPLPGALFDLAFSNPGLVTGDTCQTAPGTNAAGQCTVTVNSSTAGPFVLTVNGLTNQGPNGPTPNQPFVLPAPVSSQKTWTTYRVQGDSAVNLVGQTQHTFTLRGFQSDGTSEVPVRIGTVIAYSWSGAGAVNPAEQCTVDSSGSCNVTVNAAGTQPESSTLTVTSITVNLPNGTGDTSYTLSPGDVALSAPLPVLTKSWIAFRVRITPSSQTNLVGQPHTFIVTAEFSDTPGVWQPVSGGSVGGSWTSAVAQPDPTTSTCPTLSANGTCTFVVVQGTPPQPGTGTLQATSLTAPTVTIGGQTTTITDQIGPSALDLSAATGQKTWVLIEATITPGVDNLAGESHTFTVQVTGFDGDGPFPDGTGIPNAIVDSSVLSTVGAATVTGDTCASPPGTDASGQCGITVTNPGSGSIQLQLQQVTVTIDGQPFVVDLTPGTRGLRSDATLPIQTDKVWWQYRVILSNSSVNPLGVSHTFTATVQRSNDNGATWQPVPAGTLLQDTWTDALGVSSVDTANSTCLTTGTAALDGTCTFVVTSTAATTGTLTIQGIASTFLDRNRNGQSGAPTDPVPDPEEFASEIVSIPSSAFGTGSNLTASKTWWDFAVDVSGPAENPVGTDHTFTLTVSFSDGSGFHPVQDGTTMTYSWSGPSGSAEDTSRSTCDPGDPLGTVNGQCTVVIDSPTVPGQGVLTIDGIASTSIPQPPPQPPLNNVVFTFPTPGTTTKTWISYQAAISPDSTNLAGTSHDFTVTVQQDRGDGSGFVAVQDGTTIAVALSDPSKLLSQNCSTTGTAAGICTVRVTSTAPGTVTLTPGAIGVALLSGADPPTTVPVTVQPGTAAYATPPSASKTWDAYMVTVSPSATNLEGVPHDFTITATVTDGTTTTPAAGASIAFTWTGAGSPLTPGPCTTNATGTCTVTVNSAAAGSGTLTVTSLTDSGGRVVDLTTAGAPGQAPGQTVPLTATKTWGAYLVTISPSASNPEGTQHNFVITATVNDGTTTAPAVGATIAFTWTGAGTLVTPSPCTTDATGTCTVSVTSPSAGSGTLQVTSLTDSAGATVNLTVPDAPGQAPGQAVPLEASKTWLQYRVLLTPSATNLTGVPHTFTATVQQTGVPTPTEADWTAVPNGTTLTVTPSGPGTVEPTSSCLTPGTTAGSCQFVVHDAGPGTLTLTVNSIGSTVLDGTTFTNIGLSTPATASKTWVAVSVSVTPPSATNLTGEPHTFTVHVDVAGADGTATPLPADGATVTWTFNGPATATADTCATGTTAGTCVVSFSNSTAGAGTFTATSATVTVNGQPFTVDLTTAGANGQAPGQVVPVTAAKTWVAYTVTISPSASNPVGTQHTFTITAMVTNGTTTTPAANATISFSLMGAGTLVTPSPCTTDANGMCTVTMTSSSAGTGTLQVMSLTDSGGATVDLTASGMPGQAPGQVVPLESMKTWIAYRALISPDSTNLAGAPHPFTITVQQDRGDGAGFVAVPDGTTLAVGLSDPTKLVADTCATGTTGGMCTVTVTSTNAGSVMVTPGAITVSLSGSTFVVQPGTAAYATPATATKTWLSVAVSVTPGSATNLAGESHTFTVHVNVLGDNVSADGATVAWNFDGPGTETSDTCATGVAAGTCEVTFSDSATGSGTFTVESVTFTANGQMFTVNFSTPGPGQATPPPITATKTWGNFRVSVTPATATNFVGQPHTFTVLVEHDAGDGNGFQPLAGAPVNLTSAWTGPAPKPTVPASCTTDASGHCTVTVNATDPGTLTLTATFDATSGSGETVPFTGTGTKTWAGWTLEIKKASSVTGSTQLFSFTTTGFAPPNNAPFELAIGQPPKEFAGLPVGTFTVTEDTASLPAPWRFESLSCTGEQDNASVTTNGPTATVNIALASPTGPGSGGVITCTYTNEQMNLVVHKTDGGATPVAGGASFNYTVTVTNEGSVATADPVTVNDTLGPGLTFAGTPTVSGGGGSCAAPAGSTLTCTLTAPIDAGATVTIVVPARVLSGTVGPVKNVVTIDSPEDPLCPNGACPPPPECPAPAIPAGQTAAVLAEAVTASDPPSDNQACVLSAVTAAGGGQIVPPPPTITEPLARTGIENLYATLGGVLLLTGFGLVMLERRRRPRTSD